MCYGSINGIATSYRMGSLGCESWQPSRPALGSPASYSVGTRGSFPGVIWLECVVDY